ncbi:conserved Plasmodium protein, unknown function [Plasmodium berghei]|uniref:YGGT family protein, putative n=2 Tax=Plasmodium berghei TaxID=5821 RepID=A0A509AE53_PLABA|nr:YGGT family protein, putative [Plasmodium berghei ANKA]CXI02631.1 conserved Plasmodium protein, unknown function [Plasmodium berghei]SCM15570.1 conserved Plasmodium protein, unknown function [Plasmodium berghei]SCM17362.1 conserved Plasmodium protein, unknown function [Plasmodium berghei]VUC54335.1 YGGT family protein, putative [Plasmodium berghei ANKA]|eukprot:XP_034420168.1 YGGT family protein, putative [Plasmodium berghei ANKA]
MPFNFIYILFIIFFLLPPNIEGKKVKISVYKAYILYSQKTKKYQILTPRNIAIKNIKEIQKVKSCIFIHDQIQDISNIINENKLFLLKYLVIPSSIKLFLKNLQFLRLPLLHFIRIYKFIIYIRCLLEWLPQVNPHLSPFVYVFTYTNNYVQFFHKSIPNVFGIDLSGIFSWLFLELIESFLS